MQPASFTHSALLKVPLMTNGSGGQRSGQMALASLQVCCSSSDAQMHNRKISVFGTDKEAAEIFLVLRRFNGDIMSATSDAADSEPRHTEQD